MAKPVLKASGKALRITSFVQKGPHGKNKIQLTSIVGESDT